jgi:hypothetical protein
VRTRAKETGGINKRGSQIAQIEDGGAGDGVRVETEGKELYGARWAEGFCSLLSVLLCVSVCGVRGCV